MVNYLCGAEMNSNQMGLIVALMRLLETVAAPGGILATPRVKLLHRRRVGLAPLEFLTGPPARFFVLIVFFLFLLPREIVANRLIVRSELNLDVKIFN